MDNDNKEMIWDYLVKRIVENKDVSRFYNDKPLQRKQYLVWRKELINYFAEQLNAATIRNDTQQINENIRQFSYFRDFERMGIDPMSIFHSELVDTNEEEDYQSWLKGGRNSGVGAASIIDSIK